MTQKIIESIIADRDNGLSYSEISNKYNISKSSIVNICKKDNIEEYISYIKEKEEKKQHFTSSIIENASKVFSYTELCEKIGKYPTNNNIDNIKKIISERQIDISHFSSKSGRTQKEPFCENSPYKNNNFLKKKLLKLNIKKYECEKCHNTEWNNEKIPLEIHHINGNRHDNRLINLQLLCPNCHAQTDNYCGRNKKKYNNNNNGEKIKNFLKKNITATEIIEKFKENGSLSKVATLLNISFKKIKNILAEENIPYERKAFRKYVTSHYGDYAVQDSKRSATFLKEYNKCRRKAVDCYDKENNFIKHYSSITDVKKDGFLDSCVGKCCNNKAATHKGYIWRFS